MKSVLTNAARLAGAVMLRHYQKLDEAQIERKTSAKDLVTFVDREAEKIIFEHLNNAFPDHGLLGEESGEVQQGEARFIIDPIDGTVNYAHGVPHFAVSIARQEKGKTTHGLIYAPVYDEMFYAEEGTGASVNGEPIHVSESDDLMQALVATGFACVRAGMKPDGVDIFHKIIYQLRDLRRLGAATIDLAYVAKGVFEGFYEIGLSPWDVAAGAFIVERAGGLVTGFAGDDDPIFGQHILVTNGKIHEKLQTIIEEALKR